MNSKNVKVGNYYRHKQGIGWAKVIEIMKPKQGWNTSNYVCAKCEWTLNKNENIGLIKYFKLSDLIED